MKEQKQKPVKEISNGVMTAIGVAIAIVLILGSCGVTCIVWKLISIVIGISFSWGTAITIHGWLIAIFVLTVSCVRVYHIKKGDAVCTGCDIRIGLVYDDEDEYDGVGEDNDDYIKQGIDTNK